MWWNKLIHTRIIRKYSWLKGEMPQYESWEDHRKRNLEKCRCINITDNHTQILPQSIIKLYFKLLMGVTAKYNPITSYFLQSSLFSVQPSLCGQQKLSNPLVRLWAFTPQICNDFYYLWHQHKFFVSHDLMFTYLSSSFYTKPHEFYFSTMLY